METFLVILYFVLGYWAYGYVILRGRIIIGGIFDIFYTRLILGALFGWILIPIALIMKLFKA
ncbi:MAG: hypothetical protein IKS17_09675 [Firmicutes bacterium]|nr:hypothetical protein [Bacillota bacterium]